MNKFKISFGGLILLLVFSCGDSPKVETNNSAPQAAVRTNTTTTNFNLSVLLDLSDRINPVDHPNPTMDYYIRDVNYIKQIASFFDSHLRGKKKRLLDDKIQLFVDPAPQNKRINEMLGELKKVVNRKNASTDLLENIKRAYSEIPTAIYDLAIKDGEYIGSDIWRFFKSQVKDYCIQENYRNVLIILTDGYVYHKNTRITDGNYSSFVTARTIKSMKLNSISWEQEMEERKIGLIPANTGLENLEVLVLGLNPSEKNPFEEDILVKYWSDWLSAMGVQKFEVKTALLPSNMEVVINKFLSS